jgi:poly(ADP-ribose) glycohydrolase ARH3
LRQTAIRSAEITHTNKLGKEAAVIQAYAVSLALQTVVKMLDPEGFLEKLIDFTENEYYKAKLRKAKYLISSGKKREIIRQLGNSVEALNSVPTAIYCFTKNYPDYVKAVSYAVSLGGDTDTIGAMTGAISGAFHGQEKLPQSWRQKLEKSQYLSDLAQKLWKLKNSFSIQNDASEV